MEEKGYGWMIFAFVLLVIAGAFNVLWGITALYRKEFVIDQVLWANLRFWGWFWLILGIIEILAGISLLSKGQCARWIAIIIASINAILIFSVIWVYPIWSIVIISMDILVIYGLAVYGGRGEVERTV